MWCVRESFIIKTEDTKMKKVCLMLSIVVFLAVSAGAELIAYEPFDYPDGGIDGQTGGFGWDWDNVAQVHTPTVSDWGNGGGTRDVVSGALETSGGNSRREYNGPGTGNQTNPDGDERLGAFRGNGVIYYAVTYTQLEDNGWSGFSGYDYGAERLFYGMPGGQKNFGIDESGVGSNNSSVPVVVGQTYRLISALDFDNDQLLLWVDPNSSDFHNRTGGANSALVERFYGNSNWNTAVRLASGNRTRWDDLVVATTFEEALINPGTLASGPSPANGAKGVGVVTPTFSWAPGKDPNNLTQTQPGVVSYNLYMSAADGTTLTFVDTIPAGVPMLARAELTLGSNLEYGATYRWRVDMILSGGRVVEGLEWKFEAVGSEPVIESQSGPQTVPEGGTGIISVTTTCPFPITYQWYKVDDGGDIMLSDTDPDISGAQSAELTIANMELGDEANYYCIVTNDRVPAEDATSADSFLAMQRMIAYWDFENDSIQSLVAGSPVSSIADGDPQFVPGKVGNSAMHFDGGDDIVSMAYEDRDYFNICNTQMTVAAWVKTDVATGWNGYITRDGEGGRGWQIRQRGGNKRACFTTRPGSSTNDQDGEASTMEIADNVWHFVVGVYDLASGKKKLYIDGRFNTEDDLYGPISYSRANVALGGRQRDGGNHDGQANVVLDDVRIYNHPLSSRQIAGLYTDVETDVMICVDNNLPAMDLNGNCIVDEADLLLFVLEWLDSNWVY